MINRFDVFPQGYDSSFRVYKDAPFVPDLSMLDNYMKGIQEGVDTLRNIPTPKYLNAPDQEGKYSDREAAMAIKERYNNLLNQATDLFSKGNFNEGKRFLNQAKQDILNDQTQGDVYQLNRRLQEYKDIRDRLEKTEGFKDNPLLLQYGLNRIGVTPFKDQTGIYGTLKEPNVVRAVPEKELNDFFQGFTKSIEDTLLAEGVSKQSLDGITDLYSFRTKTGRTLNDIATQLANSIPQEYKQSILQAAAARGEKPDANIFQFDKDGNVMLDSDGNLKFANTELGRRVGSYARARAKEEVKTERIKDDDEATLAHIRSNLALDRAKKIHDYKEEKKALSVQPYAETKLYEVETGMKEMKENFDKDGKTTGSRYTSTPVPSYAGITSRVDTRPKEQDQTPFVDQVFKGDMESKYPGITQIARDRQAMLRTLDKKQAAEVLQNAYNAIRREKSNVQLEYYKPQNKKQVEELQKMSEYLVGKDGNLGVVADMTLYVQDNRLGTTKPMTIGQVIKQYYGGDAEKFTKMARLKGDQKSTSPYATSGQLIQLTVGEGRRQRGIDLIAVGGDVETEMRKAPLKVGNSPLYNQQGISEVMTFNNDPTLLARYPKGIYTQYKAVLESDVLNQELAAFKKELFAPGLSGQRRDQIKKEINKLEGRLSNMKEDKVVTQGLVIKDAQTNEDVGTYEDWNQIQYNVENNLPLFKQENE